MNAVNEINQIEGRNVLFKERLNSYISEIKTNQKSLAAAADLSKATVSRYCSGEREPDYDSRQIRQLAKGIALLSAESAKPISEETAFEELNGTVRYGSIIDYERFLGNLNVLLDSLDVRGSELARALNYDPSHISKILSGVRRPGNVQQFAEDTAAFIALKYAGSRETGAAAAVIGVPAEELSTAAAFRDRLIFWFGAGTVKKKEEPVSHFLEKLDDFDLNEFMAAIHFDDLKIPQAPFQLPTSKTYYGISKMMESELDFMKTTVLSKSMDDCILYSDMPLKEMAADPEFPKKWMFGMGLMLKKGLRLNIIHDVNRPFEEMMFGLEGNIPMYMTGQISPYYLPVSQSSVFLHLLKVSGAAALEGSAIAGKQGSGKYVLYRSKTDVAHYRRRANDLLKKAQPLMDIYGAEKKEAFLKEMRGFPKEELMAVCSSLPLCTMSEELLDRILGETGLPADRQEAIRAYRSDYREYLISFLENGAPVELVLPELTEEKFADSGMCLALAGIFDETRIPYTYGTYLEHLAETRQLAEMYEGLHLKMNPSQVFRNINFTVLGERLVVVSKEKGPVIHFVIHHKRMVQAFKNFIPPITET